MSEQAVRSPNSEVLDLTEFEFNIPCDYLFHDRVVSADAPAEWAVVVHDPLSCGCKPVASTRCFCDPCWQHLNHEDGMVYCCKCRQPRPLYRDIIRVERIKP